MVVFSFLLSRIHSATTHHIVRDARLLGETNNAEKMMIEI